MPPKGSKIVGVRRCPPMTAESEAAIREYFGRGLTDKKIIELLFEKHIDKLMYSLSEQSLLKMQRGLGLERAKSQNHTVESIHEVMLEHRKRHPNSGVADTRHMLRVESGGTLCVPRSVIEEWNRKYEPEQVEARRSRVTVKKPFVCAGVNEIWAVDQHDKWKAMGLWLHVGLDTFSGFVLWLKVWWTNSNPRLVCKFFLDAIQTRTPPGMPLLTQSDPGTENFGIANSQSTLRQMLDPSLAGSMQHIHSRRHGNIKPEIFWAGFRRRFAPGLQGLLLQGMEQGIYNPDVHIEYLVFRFTFMALVQSELDVYVTLVNTSPRRANRKSVLPTDAPINIYERPNQYGARDFKISVPDDAVTQVRELYADPSDDVFILLPPAFALHVQQIYLELGGEPIHRDNAWYYYQGIVHRFQDYELGIMEREQILYQGQLYRVLLDQSETGSARGDAWGYNIRPIAPMQVIDQDIVGANDLDEMGEMETGEFSGEEEDMLERQERPGHDW